MGYDSDLQNEKSHFSYIWAKFKFFLQYLAQKVQSCNTLEPKTTFHGTFPKKIVLKRQGPLRPGPDNQNTQRSSLAVVQAYLYLLR